MNPNQSIEAKALLSIGKCLHSEKLLFQIQLQYIRKDYLFICKGTHIFALPIHKQQFAMQHDQYDRLADERLVILHCKQIYLLFAWSLISTAKVWYG